MIKLNKGTRRTRCVGISLLGLSIVLVACGRSSNDSIDTSDSAGSEVLVQTTLLIPTIPALAFSEKKRATWLATTPANDTSSAQLSVGDLALPALAMPTPSGKAFDSQACSVQMDRDLVAPFSFKVTNANTGFSQKVFAKVVGAANYQGEGATLAALTFYTDGPSCSSLFLDPYSGSKTLGCASNDQIVGGESVTCEGFFILRGVVGPGYADGDNERITVASPQVYQDSEQRVRDVVGAVAGNLIDFATISRRLN